MLGLAQYVHGSTITPFEKLILIIENVKNTGLWTASLSLISLTWLIGARLLKQNLRGRLPVLKYIPEIFILVVVATGEFGLLDRQHSSTHVLISGLRLAMKALTGHYKLDLKGIVVLGKLEAGKGLPFGLPFQPKLWKYAHETVSGAHLSRGKARTGG
jgi:hypothetical protein